MEEKKRIRFIDSHYHTLFSIADGDSIEIVYPDGKGKNGFVPILMNTTHR